MTDDDHDYIVVVRTGQRIPVRSVQGHGWSVQQTDDGFIERRWHVDAEGNRTEEVSTWPPTQA